MYSQYMMITTLLHLILAVKVKESDEKKNASVLTEHDPSSFPEQANNGFAMAMPVDLKKYLGSLFTLLKIFVAPHPLEMTKIMIWVPIFCLIPIAFCSDYVNSVTMKLAIILPLTHIPPFVTVLTILLQ
ncbi:hypothetical protein K435DRAFT_806253 [Dendrothele bispora CBS 962.96]|uniref:Uncharacterized protein n=1 Tax=Dendrothele bispora (strain CBS 962.96) TaxID=1314807 RepID=A0A4S8L8H0_DENBC|nr:hypothetical protein K435DRAFT_806253 [Dendrothele bispora CBS 962.96]